MAFLERYVVARGDTLDEFQDNINKYAARGYKVVKVPISMSQQSGQKFAVIMVMEYQAPITKE